MGMIIDADSHYAPLDLADKFTDSNFAARFRSTLTSKDLNINWYLAYNKIKKDSWPESGPIADFHLLPMTIRQEIYDQHQSNEIKVSDDLDKLYVYDFHQQYASSMQEFRDTAKKFLKLDRQLINPSSTPMHMDYFTDAKLAKEIMQLWNRKGIEIVDEHPEFDFNPWLAFQDLPAAYEELEFIVSHSDSYFGIYMSDSVPWGFLPWTDKLFEVCEKYRIPLYLHLDVSRPSPPNWHWDYNDPKWIAIKQQWPSVRSNWLISIVSFIAGGVFERYPNLRVVVAEHGTNWIKTVENFFAAKQWESPLKYFQKNYWYAIEIDEEEFLQTASRIGFDRMLFSTDYPHDDIGGANQLKDVDNINYFLAQGMISQEQYDLVTYQNYIRLKNRLD